MKNLKEILNGYADKILPVLNRYLYLLIVGLLLLKLISKHQMKYADYAELLPVILSTIGITVAIIITFLFAKLFSEKSTRVERKRQIDIEAKKVTAFRKICYFLKGSNQFWEPFGNLKNMFDNKYKHLTLSYYDSPDLDYEAYTAFTKEVNYGESGGQAYAGLRLIEGVVSSSYVFHNSQYRKNYTLEEIGDINDACSRVWKFLDTYKTKLVDINSISNLDKLPIKENIKIIYPEFDIANFNNNKLIELFSDFQENITHRHYYLLQKNSKSIGKPFTHLLINLLLFGVLIILGLLVLSLNYQDFLKIIHIQVLISLFIINVIDLLINVIVAIRKELIVEDFYEL